ncbi:MULTISPECIES: energy-coupling factor transporter transmembrane component T family protein [unclassified Modestobacter]|uniref:energy-coupling factor transporter transmembrane component T family protein n=1 Tax=unclassified Modestobacter TaxID=2643866 RepID=UPI0022AA784E|nr:MULTISPECIES: energy-coupling factor transporter transmembrane component T [unclassified Modestobacter]MCZ2822911.1 energy-coupling factor transporter transmembrane component T [Modestobacter sp. VKM Ac-2981]MCZ2851157.1 energy-coupling factor transporter transmembrane component T [Modestobacter sp. VKM Ac-2982]
MSAPLSLGPARPVPLSAVNPVAQLSAVLVVTCVLLVSGDLVTPGVLLAAELALLPAAGLSRPGDVLRRTWPLLLSALGVAWVNVAFGSLDGAEAWLSGATWALRVVALALPGILLVASTDPVRLADALTVHWRVSTRFAYGSLAALRLVPLLAAEWETIRLARRARGVEGGRDPVAHVRLLASTAFALLVGAIRRGSRLATAMDARGFDSGVTRTNARGSRLQPLDRWFVTGAVALCAAAVTASVLSGAWSPVFS